MRHKHTHAPISRRVFTLFLLIPQAYLLLTTGCNSSPAEPGIDRKLPAATSVPTAPQEQSAAAVPSTILGKIDMGEYVISVHAVTPYHPDPMQSKMMKWDDATRDYYTIDCSVTNKTDKPIDPGKDMLAVYFTFNDGTTSTNILRGASILASAQVGRKLKYPRSEYDKIWGKTISAKETVTAELFGVEAPESATITGFGFYKNNKARNREVTF